jgi:hypothetical protein
VPFGDAIATWIAAGLIAAPAFVSATTAATGFGLDGVAAAGLDGAGAGVEVSSWLLLPLLLLSEVVLLAAIAVKDMDSVSVSARTAAMNFFFILISSFFILYINCCNDPDPFAKSCVGSLQSLYISSLICPYGSDTLTSW